MNLNLIRHDLTHLENMVTHDGGSSDNLVVKFWLSSILQHVLAIAERVEKLEENCSSEQ